MKKLTRQLGIFILIFSLFSCGTRQSSAPKDESTESASKQVDTPLDLDTQAADPIEKESDSKSSDRGLPGLDQDAKGKSHFKSCSTKVNAGAISTGVLAVGLTAATPFVGPLLFVPAIIAAAKSERFTMSKQLMKGAIKIVAANSNDNQLVDYARAFMDGKKKSMTEAEISAFKKAKRSLEKAMKKAYGVKKVFIPNVEFAERVFVYDLRGDLCEGGIKAFSQTNSIIENLVLNNRTTVRTATNGCGGDCN
jgi:hypothetical protein